jgi:hypothetical protein
MLGEKEWGEEWKDREVSEEGSKIVRENMNGTKHIYLLYYQLQSHLGCKKTACSRFVSRARLPNPSELAASRPASPRVSGKFQKILN